MELTEGESNQALFSDVHVGNSITAPCRVAVQDCGEVNPSRLADHLVIMLYVNFA